MDKLTTAGGVQQVIQKMATVKLLTDYIRYCSDYCAIELADLTNALVEVGKEYDTDSIMSAYKSSKKLMEKYDKMMQDSVKLDKSSEKLIDLVEQVIRESTFT